MTEIISKIKPDSLKFQQKYISRVEQSKKRSLSFLNYCHDHGVVFPSVNTAQNISNCSSWLKFRHYEDDSNVLHDARFCKKDKLCSACAMRRATKQVLKVKEQLENYKDLNTGYWYYIVIPVKHNEGEEFYEVHNRLKSVLKGINQSIRDGRRGKSNNIFSMFNGTMTSEEFTKSKNGWNVHANLLVHSEVELDLTYSYTSDKGHKYYYSPDISTLISHYSKNGSYRHTVNPINMKNKDDLVDTLQEIFKYALKFSELDNKDLFTVYFQTAGKRLLASSGSLRNIKYDVVLKEEDRENKLFYEVLYSFMDGSFGFGKHDHGKIRKGKTYFINKGNIKTWTIYEELGEWDNIEGSIILDPTNKDWNLRRSDNIIIEHLIPFPIINKKVVYTKEMIIEMKKLKFKYSADKAFK